MDVVEGGVVVLEVGGCVVGVCCVVVVCSVVGVVPPPECDVVVVDFLPVVVVVPFAFVEPFFVVVVCPLEVVSDVVKLRVVSVVAESPTTVSSVVVGDVSVWHAADCEPAGAGSVANADCTPSGNVAVSFM